MAMPMIAVAASVTARAPARNPAQRNSGRKRKLIE
jgi:hypothetical protein